MITDSNRPSASARSPGSFSVRMAELIIYLVFAASLSRKPNPQVFFQFMYNPLNAVNFCLHRGLWSSHEARVIGSNSRSMRDAGASKDLLSSTRSAQLAQFFLSAPRGISHRSDPPIPLAGPSE